MYIIFVRIDVIQNRAKLFQIQKSKNVVVFEVLRFSASIIFLIENLKTLCLCSKTLLGWKKIQYPQKMQLQNLNFWSRG